jgi:type IV pilus biogenesis protein CpaD/CtpE
LAGQLLGDNDIKVNFGSALPFIKNWDNYFGDNDIEVNFGCTLNEGLAEQLLGDNDIEVNFGCTFCLNEGLAAMIYR